MHITRKETFTNGDRLYAEKLNAELDQILDLLNGKLDETNISSLPLDWNQVSGEKRFMGFAGIYAASNELPATVNTAGNAVTNMLALVSNANEKTFYVGVSNGNAGNGFSGNFTWTAVDLRKIFDDSGLQSDLSELDTRIKALEDLLNLEGGLIPQNKVNGLPARLSTIETDLSGAEDALSNASSKNASQDSSLFNLDTRLTSLERAASGGEYFVPSAFDLELTSPITVAPVDESYINWSTAQKNMILNGGGAIDQGIYVSPGSGGYYRVILSGQVIGHANPAYSRAADFYIMLCDSAGNDVKYGGRPSTKIMIEQEGVTYSFFWEYILEIPDGTRLTWVINQGKDYDIQPRLSAFKLY